MNVRLVVRDLLPSMLVPLDGAGFWDCSLNLNDLKGLVF